MNLFLLLPKLHNDFISVQQMLIFWIDNYAKQFVAKGKFKSKMFILCADADQRQMRFIQLTFENLQTVWCIRTNINKFLRWCRVFRSLYLLL